MSGIDRGKVLLTLARNAIACQLGLPESECIEPGWTREPAATFVTLTLNRALRGCIGTLEAHRSLAEDVRHNAVASAFHDPRFDPLGKLEFPHVVIEVSLLSQAEAIMHSSQENAISNLTPGTDGVILQYRTHRATYLPQVWEQLPDAKSFLASLKRKAGLAETFWSDEISLSRYKVQKWSETYLHG
jgi:AmmeMemoRadiSam system protein A